jgi:hypothetical protein
MPCFYCGKRVSLVRQLNDPDFCSDEHRARYHDLTRLALGRLLETREQVAPAAPRRKARAGKSPEPVHAQRRSHEPQPAPDHDPAGFPSEPLPAHSRESDPAVSFPIEVPPPPGEFSVVPPPEAGFQPVPGLFAPARVPGGAGESKPLFEPPAMSLAAPALPPAFPRSGDPATMREFPAGAFASAPHEPEAHAVRFRFRAAQPVPYHTVPAQFPEIASCPATRVAEPAGALPAPPLDPAAVPRTYSSAAVPFEAPGPVHPEAALRGPAGAGECAFERSAPPQAFAPPAPRAALSPALRIAAQPVLPEADTARAAAGAMTAASGLKELRVVEAVRPASARSKGGVEAFLIPPPAPGLPRSSVPRPVAPPPAVKLAPGGPAPQERGSDSGLGCWRALAACAPIVVASPVIAALQVPRAACAPNIAGIVSWTAQPKNAGEVRAAGTLIAVTPATPSWPTLGIASAAAATPRPCPADSSWIARPAALVPEPKAAAAAFAAMPPSAPQTSPAGRRGIDFGVQNLLPLQARPGAQPGKAASPFFTPPPEMPRPQLALPAFAASKIAGALACSDLAPARGGRPADMPAAYRKRLDPAPLGLTAAIVSPVPVICGAPRREVASCAFAHPATFAALNLKLAPAVRPSELPATGPACPESRPVELRCRLSRALPVPYAVQPAARPFEARAAGFEAASLAPALPGARAVPGVLQPARAGIRRLPGPAQAGIVSKPAGFAWEIPRAPVRLPQALPAPAARGVPEPAAVLRVAAHAAARPRDGGLRAEGFAELPAPGGLLPDSAAFACGLNPAPLSAIARPAPESRAAAAVPAAPPPPPVVKRRRTELPKMRSNVERARMPGGLFLLLEVPDFDDDGTARMGPGFPAAGPAPRIPGFALGPECPDSPRPGRFEPVSHAPARGFDTPAAAGPQFAPRAVILPRAATPPVEFDFYAAAAAPRERGWSLVTSVFRVVLFALALPPAGNQPPGAEPPSVRFEARSTHAAVRVVGERAAAQWKSLARLTHE